MHNAAIVGEAKSTSDIEGDPRNLFDGQAPVSAQDLGKALALDVLHHDVIRTEFFAPVVDRDDVRVVQICRCLGLAAEPFNERRVGGIFRKKHLDGNRPAQQLIARKKHISHATTG